MGKRNTIIINLLNQKPQMTDALARACNCPDASIRRNVQELRRLGYNIHAIQYPTGWEYRLSR